MNKIVALFFISFFLLGTTIYSQNLSPISTEKNEQGLFDSEELLEITLSGNLTKLLRDKTKDPKKYPLTLSYTEANNKISLPIKAKTRGNFRRLIGNCAYLPLKIYFPKSDIGKQTIFRDQRKMKLVMPCSGKKYVVHEYLVYKLYNLVTPKSFKVRLVKVQIDNQQKKKQKPAVYGILLEEEAQMAERNEMVAVERKLHPTQVQRTPFLNMAVFEYLIGNTDWSVQYLQNIKLLAADSLSTPYPVPYDFDHAGIVSAPYAKPADALKLSTIKERRYRGYCSKDLKKFGATIAFYNELKPAIYRVYQDCDLLEEKYKAATLKYLDEFYETINNPKKWQKDFTYPCDPNGTGNVVIQGLNRN